MKRDWEIIRQILLRLEEKASPNGTISMEVFGNFEPQDVGYNMRLLSEAGYIDAQILNTSDGSGKIGLAIAKSLTNEGHDLLDTIRSNTVWEKIKEKFESKGIDMTFELVMSVGKRVMENLLA